MHHLVIIGSGPAGLTAAIYAARANLSPLLIEGWQSGGQLTTTTEVENYPGFSKGIMGPELMKEMRGQAERFGTQFLTGDVTAVDLSRRPFQLTVDGEQILEAGALILATGASPIRLGLPNEQRLTGYGVSTCATCDGYFFRGQDLVVVGGGDSAVEAAIACADHARSVHLSYRGDAFNRVKPKNRDRLEQLRTEGRVHLLLGSEVKAIHPHEVELDIRGDAQTLPNDAVIVSIGGVLPTDLLKSIGIRFETKYGERA